jgi:hypothetical protein
MWKYFIIQEINLLQAIKKMLRPPNSDGLIKCIRQRQDRFVINPNIYALKFCSIYKMLCQPDSFVYRDSIIGLLADALVPRFLLLT